MAQTTFERFLEDAYTRLWEIKNNKDMVYCGVHKDEEAEIDFLINRIDKWMGR